jgi:hypothetical protein
MLDQMNEQQALDKMVYPSMRRPTIHNGGVLQIWVTRACDLACYGCTQGSNLRGKPGTISIEQFEQACISLMEPDSYFGTIGMFGGNPAVHPQFELLCEIMRAHIPKERCGLWCNNLMGKGAAARRTFNPAVSNLNCHLREEAYLEFKRDWPESMPFGRDQDSRHSPPFVALQDIVYDEEERWELISNCDINKYWSAMICVFRGQLRGYFCEIAGAQAMLHQNEPEYPDLGLEVTPGWWKQPNKDFHEQVKFHCHVCGIPLKGHGELAQCTDGREQVSITHSEVYNTKVKGRRVDLVTSRKQLGEPLHKMVDYLGNANK